MFKTLAVNDLPDHHGIEAMVGIVRFGTDGIGMPPDRGRTGFRWLHTAAPRLNRNEGANGQFLLRNEIDAVFAGVFHETKVTWALIQKTEADDGLLLLPSMFASIWIRHIIYLVKSKFLRPCVMIVLYFRS